MKYKLGFIIAFLTLASTVWGSAGLPQAGNAYQITPLSLDGYYSVQFTVPLSDIPTQFHQLINNQIRFHVEQKVGNLFEEWTDFEREVITDGDIQDSQLNIRLDILDIWNVATMAIDNRFEFRIRYELSSLYNLIPFIVGRGLFAPTTSPLLTIDIVTESDDSLPPSDEGPNVNNDPALSNDPIDQDGVPFEADNCPGTSNADQRDGDRDGLGDACDTDTSKSVGGEGGGAGGETGGGCMSIPGQKHSNFRGECLLILLTLILCGLRIKKFDS
ncbi:MAG: thrombospondin type 3 repeat-containing protein [bacterium]|nr:thrombospondin type 3 repeat-containing protein [bacterium]